MSIVMIKGQRVGGRWFDQHTLVTGLSAAQEQALIQGGDAQLASDMGVVPAFVDAPTGDVALPDGRTAGLSALAELHDSAVRAAPIVPWDSTIAELRRAATAAANEGRRFRIPRTNIELTEPWEIDVSKTKCDFDDTVFSAGHTGDILTFVGRQAPTYYNSKKGVGSFAIVGAGEGELTSRGIVLSDSVDLGPGQVSGPNRIKVGDFAITQCGRGIVHWSRSYGELIHNYAVWDCGIGVHMPPLAVDAGEGSSHFKGFVFQCADWGLKVEGSHGTFMHFAESHWDHNQGQIYVGGKAFVTMSQPHIEAVDYTKRPIYIDNSNGSALAMLNPTIVITKDGTRTVDYFADVNAPPQYGGGLFLLGIARAHKLWTTSGDFATGPGNVHADGFVEVSDAVAYKRFAVLKANQTLLIDGGFENSGAFDTLPDKIQIYGDATTQGGSTAAGEITSRLTGNNITISRSTSAIGRTPRTGNGFLTVRHLGNPGTEGRFFVAGSIRNWRKRLSWRFWVRKPDGVASGSFTINPVYAALERRIATGGAQVWQHLRIAASEPPIVVTLASLADGWNLIQSRCWGVAPALPYEWATDGALFIDSRQTAGSTNDATNFLEFDDFALEMV